MDYTLKYGTVKVLKEQFPSLPPKITYLLNDQENWFKVTFELQKYRKTNLLW